MSGRSVSIAFGMKLTALVALNLAALRLVPFTPQSPPLLLALVTLNIVIVQTLLLRRALGAFHYTFIVVGLVSTLATSVLVYVRQPGPNVGSLHVLETLLRWYREVRGDRRKNVRIDLALIEAERCVTSTLSLLPAWGAGLLAVGLERRGWRIKVFFGGAVIGIAVLVLATTLSAMMWGVPAPQSTRWYAHVVATAACPLLGGLVGVVMSRSTHPGSDDSEP